jgi:hypothetical protein
MGLDMYLSKRFYVKNWNFMGPEELHEINIKKGGKPCPHIDTAKISHIITEVAYWRKANQIHDWFVKKVQKGEDNCGEYWVSKAQLQELYDTCVLVRDNSKLKDGKIENGYHFDGEKRIPNLEDGKIIEDPSVAKELLPTAAGFFFGGTDYDEYYMEDILNTITQLEPLVKDENDDCDFYYRSSW